MVAPSERTLLCQFAGRCPCRPPPGTAGSEYTRTPSSSGSHRPSSTRSAPPHRRIGLSREPHAPPRRVDLLDPQRQRLAPAQGGRVGELDQVAHVQVRLVVAAEGCQLLPGAVEFVPGEGHRAIRPPGARRHPRRRDVRRDPGVERGADLVPRRAGRLVRACRESDLESRKGQGVNLVIE
ncbi:hypothetical protein GCM10009654_26540 [Streptomyces hebeiensis]|uniref:Uncharacterized protein n=1 Tax=Streptomyces hebeiensis TaxID=229486 RepID=A0ABN1UU67_9ACTN